MTTTPDLIDAIVSARGKSTPNERIDAILDVLAMLPGNSIVMSVLTDAFAQPAEGNTVTLEVDRTLWMAKGMGLVVSDDALGAVGLYEVTEIIDDTHVTVELARLAGGTEEGDPILEGGRIVPVALNEIKFLTPEDQKPPAPTFSNVEVLPTGFRLAWTQSQMSDWVIIQYHLSNNTKIGDIKWVRGSQEEFEIQGLLPGEYRARAWTQEDLTRLISDETIIDESMQIAFGPPEDFTVDSTSAFSLTVGWAETANYHTFVQGWRAGGGEPYYFERWVQPGESSVVIVGLPEGSYTIAAYHVSSSQWSSVVSTAQPVPVDLASSPAGFGAAIQGNHRLVAFWTSAFTPWIMVQAWKAEGDTPAIAPFFLPPIWADSGWNEDLNRYEFAYDLPRKGNWSLRGWGVTEEQHWSDPTSTVNLTAENGFLDIAESKAHWPDITGEGKPANNADKTSDAMEVGLGISQGGIEFTGPNGFIKHRYNTFKASALDGTGGFFFGKAGGYYGLSMGTTNGTHFIFDSELNTMIQQFGSGATKLVIEDGHFLFGEPGAGEFHIWKGEGGFGGGDPVVQINAASGGRITLLGSGGISTYTSSAEISFSFSDLTIFGGNSAGNRFQLRPSGLSFGLPWNKVVGLPATGWQLPTNGPLNRSGFDPSTVTHEVLAQHVAALICDLHADYLQSELGLLCTALAS